ncbi:hypothetical protein GC174_02945 [bacterium]|nr:hypothetical protein [bacterium]
MNSGKVEITLLVVVAASLMPLLPAAHFESMPGRIAYQASAQTTPEEASKTQADNKKAEESSSKAAESAESAKATEAPVEVVEETEIISISDALKQGQLAHEKNLVNKFLLGIAVLFLLIAFLLFNSLPPSSPESGRN